MIIVDEIIFYHFVIGSDDTLSILIEHGANVNITDKNGISPLSRAIKAGKIIWWKVELSVSLN